MTPFDTSVDHTLEDEVARLRPLRADDHSNLLPFSLHEPELFQYSLVPAAGADGLSRYLSLALLGREGGTEYPFIVFDKRTGEYAGSTRFYDIQPANSALQLGYTWHGKRFQGTGLNKRCKFLLLSFVFETLGMERLEFRADNANLRSIAAMKSIGCVEEGVLRSNCPTPEGGRRDSIVLSILRSEWQNSVKAMLQRKIGSF